MHEVAWAIQHLRIWGLFQPEEIWMLVFVLLPAHLKLFPGGCGKSWFTIFSTLPPYLFQCFFFFYGVRYAASISSTCARTNNASFMIAAKYVCLHHYLHRVRSCLFVLLEHITTAVPDIKTSVSLWVLRSRKLNTRSTDDEMTCEDRRFCMSSSSGSTEPKHRYHYMGAT